MGIKVLSLFDGISCGRVALERAGIEVDEYYASEIDKHAIKVSKDNWKDIVHIGDVTKVSFKDGTLYTENGEYNVGKIDLVLAGNPCQGFSMAGKQLAFDDPRSSLYFVFERVLSEIKQENPDVKFLLENVKMKKEHKNVITERLGVEPVVINSNLVSAQNRYRLYWTNISDNIEQPEDKGVLLLSILNTESSSPNIKNYARYVPQHKPLFVDPYNRKEVFNKSTTLRTNVSNGNMWIRCGDGYRKLDRGEMELLQTMPINYTKCVSYNQAGKALGNGWTVDVIAHILSYM